MLQEKLKKNVARITGPLHDMVQVCIYSQDHQKKNSKQHKEGKKNPKTFFKIAQTLRLANNLLEKIIFISCSPEYTNKYS